MARLHYEPLLDETRSIIRDLRQRSLIPADPRGVGLRRWADHVARKTGYQTEFKQIDRFERGPNVLDAGYLIACAVAADVELVIGKDPRIMRGGIEEQARDFVRALRRAAAADPTLHPSEIMALQDAIDRTVIHPLFKVG